MRERVRIKLKRIFGLVEILYEIRCLREGWGKENKVKIIKFNLKLSPLIERIIMELLYDAA